MQDDEKQLLEFGSRWADAEVAGDVGTLDGMATEDFVLVGPLGFVVDRTQWLDRYRLGDLVTTALEWREPSVRVHGDCAIVVGVHDQLAAHRGRPNNGAFRATHVLVRQNQQWRLVSMHLSPIGAPPGAGAGPS